MNICSDKRAQSLQVGAVILFGFVILSLTIFQAEGVPEENKQVEFDHSQEVATDMVEFYAAVFDTVVDGRPRTVSIRLGTDYDRRLFFVYPPPATGALETTEGQQLQFHNVTAVQNPDTNQSFDNYWANETRNYTTQTITYQPNYREYRGAADYRIEYGILAALYDETTELRLAERHEPVIDGTNISIVVFDGELQEIDSETTTVIPERVTDTTTINVTNATNTSAITLELPTGLTEANWNTSNPDSALYNETAVDNVSVSGGVAEIQLNGTMNYSLTLHKVDVGAGATPPEPTYLRNRSYDGSAVTFQIRDAFNDRVDEQVTIWPYNSTENVTDPDGFEVENGETSYTLTGTECGVSLEEDVPNATSYERINVTDACT